VSIKMGKLDFFEVFLSCAVSQSRQKVFERIAEDRLTMNGIHDLEAPVWIFIPQTFEYKFHVR
jgi:hypothetical protein